MAFGRSSDDFPFLTLGALFGRSPSKMQCGGERDRRIVVDEPTLNLRVGQEWPCSGIGVGVAVAARSIGSSSSSSSSSIIAVHEREMAQLVRGRGMQCLVG